MWLLAMTLIYIKVKYDNYNALNQFFYEVMLYYALKYSKTKRTNNNVIPMKMGIQSVKHFKEYKVKRKTFVPKY
jgi:hypothetical protein